MYVHISLTLSDPLRNGNRFKVNVFLPKKAQTQRPQFLDPTYTNTVSPATSNFNMVTLIHVGEGRVSRGKLCSQIKTVGLSSPIFFWEQPFDQDEYWRPMYVLTHLDIKLLIAVANFLLQTCILLTFVFSMSRHKEPSSTVSLIAIIYRPQAEKNRQNQQCDDFTPVKHCFRCEFVILKLWNTLLRLTSPSKHSPS